MFHPDLGVSLNRKKSVFSPIVSLSHHDLQNSALFRANIFPGFPAKFLRIFLSSFHVCRQCSPLQIKYVSYADINYSLNLHIVLYCWHMFKF